MVKLIEIMNGIMVIQLFFFVVELDKETKKV